MSLHRTVLPLAAGLLLSAAAHADAGVSAELGSTGAGLHLVVPVQPGLNARLGANYLKHSLTQTSGSVDYDLKGKLQTADLLLDWYLRAASSFHLSAGLVYNGSSFDARARPNGAGQYTLNGSQYSASEVGILTGKVDFRKAAPYLGIGWGNALATTSHWNFSVDLGAFYQGKPNVSLASSGCTGADVVCSAIAQDVAAERARLQDDANAYKVYPVLRAGLAYRF
jgi:hypothetical protein